MVWLIAASTSTARCEESARIATVKDNIPAGSEVEKGTGLLVVPLPLSDPALGQGVIPVTALFYSPVEGGRQWVTGVAGLYTSKQDWALGLAQQADLLKGKLRLTGFGGYGQFHLEFFGTGEGAGVAGRSVVLNEKGFVVLANALYRVRGAFYLGARYRYVKLNTSLDHPLAPDHPLIPALEFDTTVSGLGPSWEFDTRDVQFQPNRGVYIEGQWLLDRSALGSDFHYDKMTVAANGYIPLRERTVLALRASLCRSTDGAPFYDLCMFGSSKDLRGYLNGRYRDHAMYAVQAELRQKLVGRLGAVAFGGVGAVAPDLGSLSDARSLPAAGLGLRFQPVRRVPVNVSVDYAWGRDSQGVYLYIGEAF